MVKGTVVSHKIAQALVPVVGYTPPRFNSVVKAVKKKMKVENYTKIGNLNII